MTLIVEPFFYNYLICLPWVIFAICLFFKKQMDKPVDSRNASNLSVFSQSLQPGEVTIRWDYESPSYLRLTLVWCSKVWVVKPLRAPLRANYCLNSIKMWSPLAPCLWLPWWRESHSESPYWCLLRIPNTCVHVYTWSSGSLELHSHKKEEKKQKQFRSSG